MTEKDISFIQQNRRWPFKIIDIFRVLLILLPAAVLVILHSYDLYYLIAITVISGIGLYKMYQSYFFIEYEAPHGREVNFNNVISAFKQLDHTFVKTTPAYISARSPSSMVSSGSIITVLVQDSTVLLNARSVLGIRFGKDKDTLDIIGTIAKGEGQLNDQDKEE